jgi:hypothetical protein
MMEKDIYIHVSSKDSALYFPLNRPALFRVKLNTTLNLEGTWKMGLCSIYLKNVNLQTNASVLPSFLFIACNVCTGLIVNGTQTRILRSIDISENVSRDYSFIYYVPIEVIFIDNIEFSITTDLLDEALFSGEDHEGSVCMIIHIKRD